MKKDRIDNLINNTKATLLECREIYDSGFIKIYEEKYKLPDNRIITKQKITKNSEKEAAVVITKTIDDKYIIVVQNRVNGLVSLEFPSGYIEKGESIIEGALREVREETGYISNTAKVLDTSIPNIGTETTKVHIVYVENAEKKEEQDLDEDEYINYELFTFDEIEELINNNYIQGTINRLAFFYLKDMIKK